MVCFFLFLSSLFHRFSCSAMKMLKVFFILTGFEVFSLWCQLILWIIFLETGLFIRLQSFSPKNLIVTCRSPASPGPGQYPGYSEEQFSGRVHSSGQKKNLQIYNTQLILQPPCLADLSSQQVGKIWNKSFLSFSPQEESECMPDNDWVNNNWLTQYNNKWWLVLGWGDILLIRNAIKKIMQTGHKHSDIRLMKGNLS